MLNHLMVVMSVSLYRQKILLLFITVQNKYLVKEKTEKRSGIEAKCSLKKTTGKEYTHRKGDIIPKRCSVETSCKCKIKCTSLKLITFIDSLFLATIGQ